MQLQATLALRAADAAILRGHVAQCARDAFAAYTVDVELDEGDPCPPAHDAQIVAFIGFGGARLRGTLTVMAPRELWQRTYPIASTPGAEVGDNDLLDWCGEIVNQVLGRIKKQIAQRGVALEDSTPKALHASHLTISRSAQLSVCMLRSRAEKGAVIGVWFDAVIEQSEELSSVTPDEHATPPEEALLNEGDLLLF